MIAIIKKCIENGDRGAEAGWKPHSKGLSFSFSSLNFRLIRNASKIISSLNLKNIKTAVINIKI